MPSLTRSALLGASLGMLALLPTSSLAQFPSNDTACTRHYTVIDGDTCDKIGQKTFTSTYQVMAFNLPKSGPDCYNLEIGVDLCLGRYGNDCQMVHRATSSDDCSTIASQYGIDVSMLQANNPSMDCGAVYDGLVLCVAPGQVRPPADPALNVTEIGIQNAIRAQVASQAQVASAAAASVQEKQSSTKSGSGSGSGSGAKPATKKKSIHHHAAVHNGKKSHHPDPDSAAVASAVAQSQGKGKGSLSGGKPRGKDKGQGVAHEGQNIQAHQHGHSS